MPHQPPRRGPEDAAAMRPIWPLVRNDVKLLPDVAAPPAPDLTQTPTRHFLNAREERMVMRAEQHALEATRLRALVDLLDRDMPILAERLTNWNMRRALLRQLGDSRTELDDAELFELTQALPDRQADYDNMRVQRQRLVAQATSHELASRRWRELALDQ
jgi:hypothetical protein